MIGLWSPRVEVKLKGGLGNQLFQYATAKEISTRLSLPLTVDISEFKHDLVFKRKYELSSFNIKYDSLANENLYRYFLQKLKIIDHGAYKLSDISLCDTYEKRHKLLEKGSCVDTYNKQVKDIPENCIVLLDGYFQSEKYFESISDSLRKELNHGSFCSSKSFASAVDNIYSKENPICVGIRRDNVSFCLSDEYYRKAFDVISSVCSSNHYFIFTLDIKWAKNKLKFLKDCTFIEPSEFPAYDLLLMKSCKHFIIPNSTYFWWGAWLGNDKHKVVIAPNKGWGNEFTIPSDWIKI